MIRDPDDFYWDQVETAAVAFGKTVAAAAVIGVTGLAFAASLALMTPPFIAYLWTASVVTLGLGAGAAALMGIMAIPLSALSGREDPIKDAKEIAANTLAQATVMSIGLAVAPVAIPMGILYAGYHTLSEIFHYPRPNPLPEPYNNRSRQAPAKSYSPSYDARREAERPYQIDPYWDMMLWHSNASVNNSLCYPRPVYSNSGPSIVDAISSVGSGIASAASTVGSALSSAMSWCTSGSSYSTGLSSVGPSVFEGLGKLFEGLGSINLNL